MGPIHHLAYSSALGAAIALKEKDLKPALACICCGTLIDTDHVLEYYAYCRTRGEKWSWNTFKTGEYFSKSKKVHVIFHSWEAASLMWLIYLIKRRRASTLLACICGYTLHLVLDNIGNRVNGKAYFELYRIKNHFDQDALSRKRYYRLK